MAIRRINFTDETYAISSIPAESKRLINLYPEPLPGDARAPFMLRNTFGLVQFLNIGTGPILEMNSDLTGRLFVASGQQFFSVVLIGATATVNNLGNIGLSSSGIVSIALGVTAGVVCCPPRAYVFDLSNTPTMNQINDPSFPGASSVAYIDGFFVFSNLAPGAQFFCSNLLDASHYSALNFASADGRPNVITWVKEHKGDLWFPGGESLEAWYDAGTANFPFARREGSDILIGTDHPHTMRECDGGLFFLSNNGSVLRLDGYQITRVSTFAIEEWLRNNNSYQGIASAVDACSYVEQGHPFYSISVAGTTGNRTFVYDALTQRWHERQSDLSYGGFWLVRTATKQGSVTAFGDRVSGIVYLTQPSSGAENSQQLVRTFTLPPIWANTNRAFMARIELEMELNKAGSNPNVLLELSDDGGVTFRNFGFRTSSGVSRVVWTMLGSFRQRILRFTVYDIAAIYGVDADIIEGET